MLITIEEIYQDILDGKRKRFPFGTWNEDVDGELAKRVTRYLIEDVFKWNDDDIREKWNQSLIIKSKLTGVINIYRGSPYEMLNAAYPNRFEPWELKRTPKGFWTYEKSLKVLKKIIEEKEKLTEEKLLNVYGMEWIVKKGLGGPISMYFNDSPYKMLNAAYPNRFKEWELKSVPKYFWTKEKALEALHWWIEKKEKITKEELLNAYGREWLKERGLGSPLIKYWSGNAYKMLDTAYPDQFREWELKKVSNKLWENEKKSLGIFKQIVKEKRMSKDDIKKHYNLKWVAKNGLRTPLIKFWSDSPFKMLNAAYPNQFKEWELADAPNKFWEKEKAKQIIKNEIDKVGISNLQMLNFLGRKWMQEKKLSTPFNRYWNGSTYAMLKEIYPEYF